MTLTQFKRELERSVTRRKQARFKRWAPLPIALVLLSGLTVVATHHANQLADNQAAKSVATQNAALLTAKQQLETTKANHETGTSPTNSPNTSGTNTQSTATVTGTGTASNSTKSKTTTGQTKYATSSDPASTDYSLTPPAANPASFEKPITHNNQYAPGTVVSYNATKGEKAVYAGDLNLSVTAVTVSLSSNYGYSQDIIVTSPDGQTIGMPSKWWNDKQPVSIGMDASLYHSEGTSFTMRVQAGYGAIAGTTYTIRIHSGRTAQTADAYYYDYFLPVTVTP